MLAVFVTPLASMVPFAATGPVLVVVGYLMATLIKDIDFADVEVGIPALLTITLMPLTYSITVGIGAGVRDATSSSRPCAASSAKSTG